MYLNNQYKKQKQTTRLETALLSVFFALFGRHDLRMTALKIQRRRFAGSSEASENSKFSDLTQDWCKKPIALAAANGVLDGVMNITLCLHTRLTPCIRFLRILTLMYDNTLSDIFSFVFHINCRKIKKLLF